MSGVALGWLVEVQDHLCWACGNWGNNCGKVTDEEDANRFHGSRERLELRSKSPPRVETRRARASDKDPQSRGRETSRLPRRSARSLTPIAIHHAAARSARLPSHIHMAYSHILGNRRGPPPQVLNPSKRPTACPPDTEVHFTVTAPEAARTTNLKLEVPYTGLSKPRACDELIGNTYIPLGF